MKTHFQMTLALVAALSLPHAWAQTPSTAHPQAQPSAGAKGSASAAGLTQGVVKKIDLTAQKVTLQHGEIKNLGMPPMTMVFRVKDRAVLSALKVGDKVRFHAEEADGDLLLTRIEKGAP